MATVDPRPSLLLSTQSTTAHQQVVTLLQFLSRGYKTFLFSQASLLSLLTNTVPGPSASEVMTLQRYTNVFIIIIIINNTPHRQYVYMCTDIGNPAQLLYKPFSQTFKIFNHHYQYCFTAII